MRMSALDGRTASSIVRDFFHKAHGPFGALMFEVESAELSGDKWLIRCCFYPNFFAIAKVRYEVEVDARDGRILRVKQLGWGRDEQEREEGDADG